MRSMFFKISMAAARKPWIVFFCFVLAFFLFVKKWRNVKVNRSFFFFFLLLSVFFKILIKQNQTHNYRRFIRNRNMTKKRWFQNLFSQCILSRDHCLSPQVGYELCRRSFIQLIISKRLINCFLSICRNWENNVQIYILQSIQSS